MTLVCCGLAVSTSQAVAVGPAHLVERGTISVEPRHIESHEVLTEIARLEQALSAARQALKNISRQIPRATPLNVAEFIDSHLLMLEDAALVEPARDLIRERLFSAEWALQHHRDALIRVFDEMEDPYLRSRRDDVDHVVRHILDFLLGEAQTREESEEVSISGCVIVARDISPADAVVLRHRGAAAFVTEFGGPTSHTAILARSLNIPAVMGVHHAIQYLRHGEILAVDGELGTVLAGADYPILEHYRQRLIALNERRNRLRQLVRKVAKSRDGVAVKLLANVELPEDAHSARANGATGVGLYRTEFLYMNRATLPDEEEQFAVYRETLRGLNGIPLTIRTLDLGADKQIDSSSLSCPPVCNPSLGLRAIRLCLKNPDLFRPQMRAILRASAEGPVRLMLPMLTNVREINSVRSLLVQLARELTREGLPFDPHMPVGGMIEVPAAAICAARFAAHLDFLSIGTNDLIQYTLAIDRTDDTVNYLYDPLHPAVLRLIRDVIEAGAQWNKPVAMCGEMAGDPRFTRLLLGLGLREFSMQPGSILEVKEIVRRSNVEKLRKAVEPLYQNLDEEPAEALLETLNRTT